MQCSEWLRRRLLFPQGSDLSNQRGNLYHDMKDLKERAIRGGAAKVFAQAAGFVLRVGIINGIGTTA